MQDYEEPKTSRFSKAARKDELAQAASTPLPEEAKTEQGAQEDEEDADAHTKPARAEKRAQKGHQSTQGDLEDAEPAEGHAQRPADTVHFPRDMQSVHENMLVPEAYRHAAM